MLKNVTDAGPEQPFRCLDICRFYWIGMAVNGCQWLSMIVCLSVCLGFLLSERISRFSPVILTILIMLDDIVIIMKKAKLIDSATIYFAQVYEELGQMLSPALGFLPIFIKHFKIVPCINSQFDPYWHYLLLWFKSIIILSSSRQYWRWGGWEDGDFTCRHFSSHRHSRFHWVRTSCI